MMIGSGFQSTLANQCHLSSHILVSNECVFKVIQEKSTRNNLKTVHICEWKIVKSEI